MDGLIKEYLGTLGMVKAKRDEVSGRLKTVRGGEYLRVQKLLFVLDDEIVDITYAINMMVRGQRVRGKRG